MIKVIIEVDGEKHLYEINGDADIKYTQVKHAIYNENKLLIDGLISEYKLTPKELKRNIKYLSKFLIKECKKPTQVVFKEVAKWQH